MFVFVDYVRMMGEVDSYYIMMTLMAYLLSIKSWQDKKSLTLGPDDHLHVEGFALNVFSKADKQDRAGRADLSVTYMCLF